jgi:hypothetical protein
MRADKFLLLFKYRAASLMWLQYTVFMGYIN